MFRVGVLLLVVFYCFCLLEITNGFYTGFSPRLGPRRILEFRPSTSLSLTTADFKNGLTFEIDGKPVKLLEFLHVKPGKGSAFVRAKVKHLLTGTVQERTFRAGETIIQADVVKSEMQFTYKEGDVACFMNMETFEECRIPKDALGDSFLLLREALSCQVTVWNGDVIDVQLPANVEYTVVETEPPIKGNTGAGSGGQKPALLDSGATVNVPLFIETGEKILVATEKKEYLGRSNK